MKKIKFNFDISKKHSLNEVIQLVTVIDEIAHQLRQETTNLVHFNNVSNAVYGYLNNPYKDVNNNFNSFKSLFTEQYITQLKNTLLYFASTETLKKSNIVLEYFFKIPDMQERFNLYNATVDLYNEALSKKSELLIKYLKPKNKEYVITKSLGYNESESVNIINEIKENDEYDITMYYFQEWYLSYRHSIIKFKKCKYNNGWMEYFKNKFPEEYL